MSTLGLPQNFYDLAYRSPNALDTDNLPGMIRHGPGIVTPFFVFIDDWYIFPPAFYMRDFYIGESGL
jgi:hypothetical protein